ncbi:MAG: hypothetical protein ACX939_04765 [Hyphococcus sp.]
MDYGGKKREAAGVSSARLAAVAGAPASAEAAPDSAPAGPSAPVRRASVEPDLSKIRKYSIDETPEARKKRLAAKTVNFSATIIARIIIIAAVCLYGWAEFQGTGKIHRGIAVGVFAMLADLGRVSLKALDPGSK